jgi:hypothetical protein
LELQQEVDAANDPPINICRLTDTKVQIASEGESAVWRAFLCHIVLKSCRFHATLARFVVLSLEKLFPWPPVMRMLRSLKSSKLRERAQAAAKHVRGISPTIEEIVSLHARTRVLSWLNSPKLQERAEGAAKQMRYFRLFSQRGSFDELGASARRAGFKITHEDVFEARFQWAGSTGDPDFTFRVSYDPLEAVSVTAESCQRDIFGLVMTSVATEPTIVVEMKQSLEEFRIGRNADQLRRILLAFPDFDDGMEQFLRRVGFDQPFKPAGFP